MTNFFQSLDICAHKLRDLRDPGITPMAMDIEVSEEIWVYISGQVDSQGGEVSARFVKQTFTVEKGRMPEHIKIKFLEFTFNVYLYRKRNHIKFNTEDIIRFL